MATPLRFYRLHQSLKGGVAVDEVETLLDALHGDLLLTLERSLSAHTPGGDLPAFPALLPGDSKPTSPYERAASELLQLSGAVTAQLLSDFERDGHNSAQALKRAADEAPAGGSAADLLALLPSELHLLEHLHEQRCLLLRCVQQLLAIAFVDSSSPLHRVASGRVSLLFDEGLPKKLCKLATAAAKETRDAELHSRLPQRLRGSGAAGSAAPGPAADVAEARREWLSRVGAATARHADAERLELHSLLFLVQAAPLLQLQARLTLAPATDASLLEAQLGVFAAELSRPPARATAGSVAGAWPGGSLPFNGHHALRLATLATLAAMQAEQLACESSARSQAISSRHRAVTDSIIRLAEGRAAEASAEAPAGAAGALMDTTSGGGGLIVGLHARSGAVGAVALCWCAVQLERAPDETVGNLAAELARLATGLGGMEWCTALFGADGFRHDEPPQEVSSLAREVLLDLASSLVEQPRTSEQASVGWPAHSPPLARLVAAAVRGRHASCSHFWSEAESGGPLGMLLRHARYPLDAHTMPHLLGALSADADSARRAWAYAHSLRRATHLLPRRFSLFDVRCSPDGAQLRTETAQRELGSPALNLPEGAEGEALDAASAAADDAVDTQRMDGLEGPLMAVTWQLPDGAAALDAAPLLLAAVRSVLQPGIRDASPARLAAAAAALDLLAGAPRAHTAHELWSGVLPPPAEMLHWLQALAGHPELRLAVVRLLTAVAPLGAAELREQIRRSALFHAGSSHWHPAPLDDSALFLVRLVRETALPAEGEALAQPTAAALPPVQFVLLRLLPVTRGDESDRALRLKERVACLLCDLLDQGGASAAAAAGLSDAPGAQLAELILGSGAVHDLLADTLRSATGAWERGRQGAGGGLSSAATRLIGARTSLLSTALGLLLRLLSAAHTLSSATSSLFPLHVALLRTTAPVDAASSAAGVDKSEHGAVRWLALCMLLSGDDDDVDEADEEDEEDEGGGGAWLGASGGPVRCHAARCLALLCHAAGRDASLTRVSSQLVDLAPSLSALLAGWVSRAARALRAGGEDVDASAARRLGSAATQLLGAAADALPDVFAALCRGPLVPGETVRVSSLVAEPDGGWGLAAPGERATVLEFAAGGGVTLDFARHEAWYCARPEVLELCYAPVRSLSGAWVAWGDLKEQLGRAEDDKRAADAEPPALALSASSESADAPAEPPAAQGGAGGGGGPLDSLLELLDAAAAHGGDYGGGDGYGGGGAAAGEHESLGLQVQALGLLLAIWERPALLSAHARALRASAHLWRCVRRLVGATAAGDGVGGGAETPSAADGLRWLRCALALSLLSAEALSFAPPQPTRVASCIRELLDWVASSPGVLTGLLVASPRNAAASHHVADLRAAATALRCDVPAGPSGGAPQPLPVDCCRLSAAGQRSLIRVGIELPPHLPPLLPLWAGGVGPPLLPPEPMVDVEALQVRLWRMHERAARRREASRDVQPDHAAAQVALLARAAERAGTDRGAEMLDRLERLRRGEPIGLPSTAGLAAEMEGWARDPTDPEAEAQLLSAAAAVNVALLATAAHRAMTRRWRLLLALLHGPARLPPLPISTALGSAPPWLDPPTAAAPLERQLALRAAQLGRQQHAWADACAGAGLLLRHARLLSGVAMLLEEQALALRGRASFPLEVARLAQAQKAMLDDAGTPATDAGGSPLKRPRQAQRRAAALCALLAGGGGRHKKAGALAKLVMHLSRAMDEVELTPAVAHAAQPAASGVLSAAKAALSDRQALLLRRVASQAGLPAVAPVASPSADADAVASLSDDDAPARAVRQLAAQLEASACGTLGLSSPLGIDARAVEAHARRAGQLLDVSVLPQPQGPPTSPVSKPIGASQLVAEGGGAAQMLSRLASAAAGSAPPAALDPAARERTLRSSVARLVHARAGLLQQAHVLRVAQAAADAPEEARRRASRARAAQLQQAQLSCHPSSGDVDMDTGAAEDGGAAAAAAAALLAAHASEAGAAAAAAEARNERELAQAARCVTGEWLTEAEAALGAAHAFRREAAARRAEAADLWARHDVASAAAELLAVAEAGSTASEHLAGLTARLSALTDAITGRGADATTDRSRRTRAAAPQSSPQQTGAGGPQQTGAGGAVRRALEALLAREADGGSAGDSATGVLAALSASGGAASAGAGALIPPANLDEEVHELLAVLALASDSEQLDARASPGAAAGTRSASMLMVRLIDAPPRRSYLVSSPGPPGGAAPVHLLLRPDGWFHDETSRCIRRAPSALCSLLWPDQQIPLHAALQPGALSAMRKLALSLAAELERSAPVAAAEADSGWSEASRILMGVTETILEASTEASRLRLPPAEREAARMPAMERATLIALISRAVLALPLAQRGDASLPVEPLATLLLLVAAPAGAKGAYSAEEMVLPAELSALVPRLCLSLAQAPRPAALAPPRAPSSAEVHLALIAVLLPMAPPGGGEAVVLERTLLGALRPAAEGAVPAMTAAALPAVLSLCRTPRGARSLLGAGLLARLGALAPAMASAPAGWAGYIDGGERSPAHRCWCDALLVASTALGALPQPVACAWFAPAVELAMAYRPRITAALAAAPLTLGGLLELQATLRFVTQLGRIGGSEVPELDLREPLTQALQSLARLLLLSPTQLQASMPPISKAERAHAALTPSGSVAGPVQLTPRATDLPELSYGDGALATVISAGTGSMYTAELRAAAEGSLCTLMPILPLHAAGYDGLRDTFFAAIHSLRIIAVTPAALPPTAVAAGGGAALRERPLQMVAVRCVALLAAGEIKGLLERRAQLRATIAHASAHKSDAYNEEELHRLIDECASLLRALPQGLQEWVDIHTEEEVDSRACIILSEFINDALLRHVTSLATAITD